MNPKKTEFTGEEIKEQLISSILLVKDFRKLLTMQLRIFKCYFTYTEFISENLRCDTIQNFLKTYDLSFDYSHVTHQIWLYSNLDYDLYACETFFDDLLTEHAQEYKKNTHKEYDKYVYNTQSKNST